MFNGSDFNREKENTMVNFSTTEYHASLLEDQDMAKKRTLSMTMGPQFNFQPEGPDQKKQNQPQSVLGSNFVRIYPLGNIESHP
jgi:hypothetical protein